MTRPGMRVPVVLSFLARVLLPGQAAAPIRDDLTELWFRDVGKHGRRRAERRFVMNALGSSWSVWRRRVRLPRFGGFSTLDLRLGVRMLVKYPGLTAIGSLAIAFAIGISAIGFEIVNEFVYPELPFEDGDRIVGIQMWNTAERDERGATPFDLAVWEEQATSLVEIGAFRNGSRNLIVEGRGSVPERVVEVSASAFTVTRTPPLKGRVFNTADEAVGAPAVAIIGHDLWQRRFDGEADVVGTTVRLDDEAVTIVGVMPPGYEFPVADNLWTPLRRPAGASEPGSGRQAIAFARLAPGASLAQADAELDAISAQLAAEYPLSHEFLAARVKSYTKLFLDIDDLDIAAFLSAQIFAVMMVVLLCGNVALLVFARASARESEVLVRNALGASRGRIISQMFAEALVLAVVASSFGLLAADAALRWWVGFVEGTGATVCDGACDTGTSLPFWVDGTLSWQTVLNALLLTGVVAVVSGVLPALKLTRGLEARLRQSSAGAGGLRFGGVWTVVIVCQVAVTVAFPVTSFFVRRDAVQLTSYVVGFDEQQFLTARIERDRDAQLDAVMNDGMDEFLQRFGSSQGALQRALEAEPELVAVAFTDSLPRTHHPYVRFELEGDVDSDTDRRASAARVTPGYFDALDARPVAGRVFHSGDLETSRGVVVVNQLFVDEVLEGRGAIGRRLRYLNPSDPRRPAGEDTDPGPWLEIVGVVPNLGMTHGGNPEISGAGFYHPVDLGDMYPAYAAMRVRTDPASFIGTLRELTTEVDPSLQLTSVLPLTDVHNNYLRELTMWFRFTLGVSALALLLSTAGIHAVMAFTVSRRTREIGVRVALGGSGRSVVVAIFRRPLLQVGAGAFVGLMIAAAMALAIMDGLWPWGILAVVAYGLFMMLVCLLACVVPTRRALAVQPTVALNSD